MTCTFVYTKLSRSNPGTQLEYHISSLICEISKVAQYVIHLPF